MSHREMEMDAWLPEANGLGKVAVDVGRIEALKRGPAARFNTFTRLAVRTLQKPHAVYELANGSLLYVGLYATTFDEIDEVYAPAKRAPDNTVFTVTVTRDRKLGEWKWMPMSAEDELMPSIVARIVKTLFRRTPEK